MTVSPTARRGAEVGWSSAPPISSSCGARRSGPPPASVLRLAAVFCRAPRAAHWLRPGCGCAKFHSQRDQRDDTQVALDRAASSLWLRRSNRRALTHRGVRRRLGVGAFGSVSAVRDKQTGQLLALKALLAVNETVILLHPPSSFSRCFNTDGEGASVK